MSIKKKITKQIKKIMPMKYFKILALIALFFIYSTINYSLGKKNLFNHDYDEITYIDSMYFTTITLTSIGYGDITPRTQKAKVICMIEIIVFWVLIYNVYSY
jgi:hypothetical protein